MLVSSLDFENLRFQLKRASEESIDTYVETGITALTKVSEGLLGEWALPPDYESPRNNYMPSTYFGLWETQDQKNSQIIKILDNRTVISFSNEESTSKLPTILQGEWDKHGKQLHVAWEDGTYSIIDNRNEKRVKLLNFDSGEEIIDDSSEYTLITQSQEESEKSYWSTNQLALIQQQNLSLIHI